MRNKSNVFKRKIPRNFFNPKKNEEDDFEIILKQRFGKFRRRSQYYICEHSSSRIRSWNGPVMYRRDPNKYVHAMPDLKHLTFGANKNVAFLHRWSYGVCPVSTVFIYILNGALIPKGPEARMDLLSSLLDRVRGTQEEYLGPKRQWSDWIKKDPRKDLKTILNAKETEERCWPRMVFGIPDDTNRFHKTYVRVHTPQESYRISTDSFYEIRTYMSTAPNASRHIADGIDYSYLPFNRFLGTTMHCNYHAFPKTTCHFVSHQRHMFDNV